MNTNIPKSAPDLSDVLVELAMGDGTPSAAELDALVRRYPFYTAELTEFALKLTLASYADDPDCDLPESDADAGDVNPGVSRAISHFHNVLYQMQATGATAPAERTASKDGIENVRARAIADFNRHFAQSSFSGETSIDPWQGLSPEKFRQAARRVGVNTLLLIQIRDCQVRPETVPDAFKRRLACELEVPFEAMWGFLESKCARTTGGVQFRKSPDKPTERAQLSFKEALDRAGISEAKQRDLLEG
jgi:hypothetical protein